MADIHITLGGGFRDHHVAITVDGRTVFDEEGVTSSGLTDLAMELPGVPAVASRTDVSVSVDRAGAEQSSTATRALETDQDSYVVIYLDPSANGAGRIRFAVGGTGFGFG